MERDESILQYNDTNPLLGCVMSRVAKRVVTLEKMTLYPFLECILCEFSHTDPLYFMYLGIGPEPRTLYVYRPQNTQLANFIKRFGHTLDPF